MGALKNFYLEVIHRSASTVEEEDAVEYALMQDWVKLTYNMNRDVVRIKRQLPKILEQFRRVARENMAPVEMELTLV